MQFNLISALLITLYPVYVQLQGNKENPITWVDPSKVDLNNQEGSAFFGGSFRYAARSEYRGGILCGQYIPEDTMFQSTLSGTEVKIPSNNNIQVLKFPPGTVSWIQKGLKRGEHGLATRGDGDLELPHNMILCGSMPGTAEHIYACRVLLDNDEVVMGYFSFSTQICTYNHGTKEQTAKLFELLVLNNYGIVTNAAG